MTAKNPCSKTVTPEQAYEVWQSLNGAWTYFVLKKYQSPEKEAANPYARWFCMVQSPIMPKGEYGDTRVWDHDLKRKQLVFESAGSRAVRANHP